ncbi:MAG: hypothetical protein HUU02_08840 [Bacteroidetes bacterium]|nr:hypothetical protein [Bacteroidota bacterium]
MTTQTTNIIRSITGRIDAARRRYYARELMSAVVRSIAVALLLVSLTVLIESVAVLGSDGRTMLLLVALVLSALVALFLLWRPVLQSLHLLPRLSDGEVARMIGAHHPHIADRLRNTLDLVTLSASPDFTGSSELLEVSIEHFGRSSQGTDFGAFVSFDRVRRMSVTAASYGAVMLVLTGIPGLPFHDAAMRIVRYDQDLRPPAAFTILVRPGNMELLKGESAAVEAVLVPAEESGTLPKELVFAFAEEGVETDDRRTVRPDSAGVFRFLFPPLKQSLSYVFSSGEISSGRFTISVTDRPFVRTLTVALTPPAYSGLKREALEENNGDLLILPGTVVEWNIVPSKPVASAAVVMKDGAVVKMRKDGGQWRTTFVPSRASVYTIALQDEEGNANRNVIEYSIRMLTDEHPVVQITAPAKNVDITKAMDLPMQFTMSDDFGVGSLSIRYRLARSNYAAEATEFSAVTLFTGDNAKERMFEYRWDLSPLGLVPEDVVEYYAEVKDNDNVNGPKTGRSQTFLIRLPSLEEVFADAERTQDAAGKELEEALKEAQEIRKELNELSNDMKKNQQMDWQKQKKAEELVQRYEEMQKKVSDVSESIDDMSRQLQENNTLSPETLEKYMELQKTLTEMDSPEFQKAMKRMQEAMQSADPEQMRQAMQQAQFNEEQFRQSIERTMSLLKRIQIEQKVDELLKRTEEMKQAQEAVREETEKLDPKDAGKAEDLARKQEAVDRQLEEMKKELEGLQERMEQFPKEMPLEKLEEAQQAAADKAMKEAMSQSAQQLRSRQRDRAQAAQQQAASGISEMQQQLSELQEQMMNNQMQQTMNALRKAMQDLLQISQKQEQLKNRTRSLDPNSQQFREIAQQQQNLQGDLNNVANALAELSEQSFAVTPEMGKQIGRAMGQMQQAMSAVEQRNGQGASSQQGEAMASLNKAAVQMQGAMQQMQQQGGQGGGSLLQQLRGMAMQQQQINMQTEQMGNQEGMTPQQMQEMGRLARQQDAVRRSLEQLQRESEAAPEKERIMGDLGKISEEMKEVVQQLQRSAADKNTLQQQERILSRLLQAQRSMRERDYEQKRKAVTAVAPPRRSPADLAPAAVRPKLQQDLQRAQEAGYSKDYLELIRKYYEALERKEP